MAIPWLRLIDAALGIHDLVRATRPRPADERATLEPRRLSSSGLRRLETRFAAVVVAALREAFDRDSRRLELEREQLEIERARADRALRLELARQSTDREIARARFVTGTAAAMLVATLFLATRVVGIGGGAWLVRSALGLAWLLLLTAIGSSLSDQSRLARALDRVTMDPDAIEELGPIERNAVASWCMLAGLALAALSTVIA
jgi:hypothetical protein